MTADTALAAAEESIGGDLNPLSDFPDRVSVSESLLLPPPGTPIVPCEPRREDPRLAVYYRRSRRSDTSSSLSKQRMQCVERARTMGVTLSPNAEYFDDDISGRGGSFRPGIETLLKHVQERRYDGVIVQDVFRWTRSDRENRIITDVMTMAGADLYSVREPMVSLFGPTAFLLPYFVALGAHESSTISKRVSEWHSLRASVGAVVGAPPFGMRTMDVPSPWPDRAKPIRFLEPDDEPREEFGGRSAADLVRGAFDLLENGGSFQDVAKDWRAHGYPAPRSAIWNPLVVRNVLRNPALAGYATYKREIVRDKSGERLAPHTPLVDPLRWEQIVPARKRRSGVRRSLRDSQLRGLLRCPCGSKMTFVRDRPKVGAYYRCLRSLTFEGRHVTVALEPLMAWVLDQVATQLGDPEKLAPILAPRQSEESLQKIKVDLASALEAVTRLEEDYYAGDFAGADGKARYREHKAKLKARASAAESALSDAMCGVPGIVLSLQEAKEGVAAALTLMPPRTRLELFRMLIGRIDVAHAEGSHWRSSRLSITWAGQD
jgi:DNA invertase Pin-like site-specific DNA recombinase